MPEAFPVLEDALAPHRHAGTGPVLKCQLGGVGLLSGLLWAKSKNPGDAEMSFCSSVCQVLVSP